MARHEPDEFDDEDELDDVTDDAPRGRRGRREPNDRAARVAAAAARARAKSRQRTLAGGAGALVLVAIFGGRFVLRYMRRAGAESQVQNISEGLQQAPVTTRGDDRFELAGLEWEIRKDKNGIRVRLNITVMNLRGDEPLRPKVTVDLANAGGRSVAHAVGRGSPVRPGEATTIVADASYRTASTLNLVESIEVVFHPQ